MDFAVLANHKVKLKKSENRDKYLDLIIELKNMTVAPIVVGALSTITKGLVEDWRTWK